MDLNNASTKDEYWMGLAIKQARLSIPSPNPPVGALLVSSRGELISMAHHQQAGQTHAEVEAIQLAGVHSHDATLYVTLEPCNHFGKTPPCVDQILKSGIKSVVIGAMDPNPHVQGGGANKLIENGIEVRTNILKNEAEELIAPWTKFITLGIPYITLKHAVSLDGRITTRSGISKWVTGPEARSNVQILRSERDAVAVGISTVIADNPYLTVRDTSLLKHEKHPIRIVFDTHLRIPLDCFLVQSASQFQTWVMCGEEASPEAETVLLKMGCQVFRVALSEEGRVDPLAALEVLSSFGLTSILIEGGAELAGSFLASQLIDELHCYISPILLGPRGRPAAVDWAGPDLPNEAPRIINPKWEFCGRDIHVFGRIAFPVSEYR